MLSSKCCMNNLFCAECGKSPEVLSIIFLHTGRLMIDERDVGQEVCLCEDHRPLGQFVSMFDFAFQMSLN